MNNMANVALINYYAKLIQRGVYSIEKDIPEGLIPMVEQRLSELPPLPPDPETQTPAEGEKENKEES